METEMEEVEPPWAMGQGGKAGETKIRSRRGEEMGDGKGHKSRRIHHDHDAAGSSCKEEEDDEEEETLEDEGENEKIVEEHYYLDTTYDEEVMLNYRRGWESLWKDCSGGFEDATSVPSIRHFTGGGHLSGHGYVDSTLQIFSIRMAQLNEQEGLQWPLHVYGFIATRDCFDHNRNFLFDRSRDSCQILTREDSFLQLTGPSRAVVYTDPVFFEFELKAKGRTDSEDKILCYGYFQFDDTYSSLGNPPVLCTRYHSKLATQEFTFALLVGTVEATIDSVRVVKGSWPNHYQGLVVSRTASVAKENIILVDSRYMGRMPINSDADGVERIKLSRCAVSVELSKGRLYVSVAAFRDTGGDVVVKREVSFKPKSAGRSYDTCDLGFCEVEIGVAWSLFSRVVKY